MNRCSAQLASFNVWQVLKLRTGAACSLCAVNDMQRLCRILCLADPLQAARQRERERQTERMGEGNGNLKHETVCCVKGSVSAVSGLLAKTAIARFNVRNYYAYLLLFCLVNSFVCLHILNTAAQVYVGGRVCGRVCGRV